MQRAAKEKILKTPVNIYDRVACMVIGTALTVTGLIFIALGTTLLPVIGILLALPVMRLAFRCFRPGAWAIAAEIETEPDSGVSEPLAA